MNFDKYFDNAKEIYQTVYTELDNWHRERTAAEKVFKKELLKLNNASAVDAQREFAATWNNKRKAIIDTFQGKLDAVENSFSEAVNDVYRIDGAAIDANDQALLASGIMKPAEYCKMVEKHAENPTMLRIIGKRINEINGDYSKKYPTAVVVAIFSAESNGEREHRIFDQFKQLANTPVRMAQQNLAGTESFMTAAMHCDEYVQSAKKKMAGTKFYITAEEREGLEGLNENISQNVDDTAN